MEAQRRVERLCAMGRAHILGGLGQVSRNGNGTHTHTVGTHTPHTYMCSHTHTLTRTHTHTLTHTHVPTPTRMNARMNARMKAQGRRAQVHPRGQVRGGRDVLGLYAVPDLPRGAPPVRRPRLGPTRIAPAPDSANNRQRCIRSTALTPCAMRRQRTTCDAQHTTPLQDPFTARVRQRTRRLYAPRLLVATFARAIVPAASVMFPRSPVPLAAMTRTPFRDHPVRWTGGGAVRRSLALKRSAAPTAHVQVLCRAQRPGGTRQHADDTLQPNIAVATHDGDATRPAKAVQHDPF
jgi:hypothetical protein